jgi:molecular chaperone GrpE
VLDTYDAARVNKEAWEKVDPNWRSGIEYIFSTFNQKLESENLKSFGEVGDTYDANLHEAVETVETDDKNKDGTLANILMRGYKINESILREAKVKVYKLKN